MMIESPDGKGYIHICGKTNKEPCPESINGNCPDCLVELEMGYGFAGGYGLGVYNYCNKCFKVYDFREDTGE